MYIIGGSDRSSYLNKVLIFNPYDDFTHIEGPPLITKRRRHACGIMSNGQQSKIVVAGGYNRNGLSSVEIFDPTANKWIPGKEIHFFRNQMKHKIYLHAIWNVICILILFAGPPLPYKLYQSAMATSPDGGGVILFGGANMDKDDYKDTLLELRFGANEWTPLPQKLKQPRSGHVVIPIS